MKGSGRERIYACVNAKWSHSATAEIEQSTQSAVWWEFFQLPQDRKGRNMPIHIMQHDCMSCWKPQLNSSFKIRMCDFVGVLIWVCLGMGGSAGADYFSRPRELQKAFLGAFVRIRRVELPNEWKRMYYQYMKEVKERDRKTLSFDPKEYLNVHAASLVERWLIHWLI